VVPQLIVINHKELYKLLEKVENANCECSIRTFCKFNVTPLYYDIKAVFQSFWLVSDQILKSL